MALYFDGKAEAKKRKLALFQKVKKLPHLNIFSLVFQEDSPSMIYAKLKQKDAESIGIAYDIHIMPIAVPEHKVYELIGKANADKAVTGIIVQKPAKTLMPSENWWESITAMIDSKKDIDGLAPQSSVLPATVKAIFEIFKIAVEQLGVQMKDLDVLVLGRSDIVGRPLSIMLRKLVKRVTMLGRELELHRDVLKHVDVLITATGQKNLISANQLKQGVIVIDAGSPKPEVNPERLAELAAFISPVPGGVGPMTRICLLENLIDLVESH